MNTTVPLLDAVTADRDRLRAALLGFMGLTGPECIDEFEAAIRSTPAPAPEDLALALEAIAAVRASYATEAADMCDGFDER